MCAHSTCAWEKTAAWDQGLIDEASAARSVSVNVSRADIYLADVAAELHKCLWSVTAIEPRSIEVEITESAYSERPDRIVAAFWTSWLGARLTRAQRTTSGSGYWPLNMEGHQRRRAEDRHALSSTATTAQQGHTANRSSVWRAGYPLTRAEGVETREQVNFLWTWGARTRRLLLRAPDGGGGSSRRNPDLEPPGQASLRIK